LISHEAPITGGVGAEIAATVAVCREILFDKVLVFNILFFLERMFFKS
jgi:hypothetical protein